MTGGRYTPAESHQVDRQRALAMPPSVASRHRHRKKRRKVVKPGLRSLAPLVSGQGSTAPSIRMPVASPGHPRRPASVHFAGLNFLLLVVPPSITGVFAEGLAHLDQAVALYDPDAHRPLATRFGQDSRVTALSFRSTRHDLWLVHPGFRHARLEGGSCPARRAGAVRRVADTRTFTSGGTS